MIIWTILSLVWHRLCSRGLLCRGEPGYHNKAVQRYSVISDWHSELTNWDKDLISQDNIFSIMVIINLDHPDHFKQWPLVNYRHFMTMVLIFSSPLLVQCSYEVWYFQSKRSEQSLLSDTLKTMLSPNILYPFSILSQILSNSVDQDLIFQTLTYSKIRQMETFLEHRISNILTWPRYITGPTTGRLVSQFESKKPKPRKKILFMKSRNRKKKKEDGWKSQPWESIMKQELGGTWTKQSLRDKVKKNQVMVENTSEMCAFMCSSLGMAWI